MPERELALAIIEDAMICRQKDFLTGAGDYAEIATFWFQVAGLEVMSSKRVDYYILQRFKRSIGR